MGQRVVIRTKRDHVGSFIWSAIGARRHVMHVYHEIESTHDAFEVIALSSESTKPCASPATPDARAWSADAFMPVVLLTPCAAKVGLPYLAWETLQMYTALVTRRDDLVDSAGGGGQTLPFSIAVVCTTRGMRLRRVLEKFRGTYPTRVPRFAASVIAVVRPFLLMALQKTWLWLRVWIANYAYGLPATTRAQDGLTHSGIWY